MHLRSRQNSRRFHVSAGCGHRRNAFGTDRSAAQIDKINKICGAKAGDPSFIRKEDYFDDFKQEINLAENAKKLNEEIGDIVKPEKGPNNPVP